MLLVGIGGGIRNMKNDTEVNLSDVIFSRDIYFYREHKEKGKPELRSIPVSSPSPKLVGIANNYVRKSKKFNFNIYSGTVVSWDITINAPNDRRLKEVLNKHKGEILVIETESGGVARAVYESRRDKNVHFLTVRSISDFVDDPEGKTTRKKLRKKVSKCAARFSYGIVEYISRIKK